ncbi:MAG TPA: IS110 family transposase [Blastocatellia bacterium]|jgi:transposase|nr:IS110 family transposase [Blastocatellia bacterium]
MLPTLGIDISKDSFHLELSLNEKLRHRKFANRKEGFGELRAWLAKHKATQVHACLEATGPYSEALAVYLHQQGHIVSVVNPVQIKAFGQSELRRNKDDRPDAGLIRRFCEKQRPAPWTPPPVQVRELQALTRHLENLIETRQQQINRLEATNTKNVAKSLRKLVAHLDAEIKRTEQQIDDHVDRHPDLKQQSELLESIPGVGKRTAARLLAEITDISLYKSARQVAAYAGLTPRNNRSGTIRGKTRLSKTGNARVRKALFFPAIVAKRHNPIVRAFCERLSGNGKNKMQVIGAAMRKLIHIVFGVLKSGKCFDPSHELLLNSVS